MLPNNPRLFGTTVLCKQYSTFSLVLNSRHENSKRDSDETLFFSGKQQLFECVVDCAPHWQLPSQIVAARARLHRRVRPDGGVVTQRTANPCTRVRFSVGPPTILALFDRPDVPLQKARKSAIFGKNWTRFCVSGQRKFLLITKVCSVDFRGVSGIGLLRMH